MRPVFVAVFLGMIIFSVGALGQGITPELLREDFQILRHALEESHGGLYQYTSKADMDRTFDQAYKRIDRPMTGLEFWALVAPVVAHIKDGHLFTYWPSNSLDKQVLWFPLTVRVFDHRIFVYRDFSNEDQRLEGVEILSISGISEKHLLETMGTVVTGEGDSKSAVPYRIGYYYYFKSNLYRLLKIESPFHIEYRDSDGKHKANIVGRTFSELQAASETRDPDPEMTADLKFRDGGKIAVLTIRSFEEYIDSARKLTLRDFLQHSFEQIREKQSRSLIVDVRDNGGGIDESGIQLFSYLWDQPFEYYKDETINALEYDFYKYCPDARPVPAYRVEKRADGRFHYRSDPGLGLQQPRQPHFGGKVFALMNGGSISGTCEFLSMLPLHQRGVLIGEEAGGGYYGCTCGFRVTLTLPNSNVRVPLGMLTYHYAAVDYKHASRGMLPDYPIVHTINDLLTGRDREMEFALSLARSEANSSHSEHGRQTLPGRW